tara:strand:+ start:109 stop:936 length:828 start_codon:yes stop_codon:yes gene_type:complete
MINKILNNLKKPHKIPGKFLSKIKFFISKKKYDKKFYENKQNHIFEKLNLDRNLGLKKLIEIKKNHEILNNRGMASEHEVLFSSLSCNPKFNMDQILEVGTYDGANAFLLSLLFENSNIETIDLKKNHDDFKNFYNRENNISKFIELRNSYLSKNKNIYFKEINSVNLINYKKKYDLIWIDGAHGYPVVCMDIVNSLRILNDKGIIMCDDVFINQIDSDKMYSSNAAYETLSELKKEGLINIDFIFKRLDSDNNCLEEKRKFVAIISLKPYKSSL